MATSGSLQKIADERGMAIEQMIGEAITEHSSIFRASLALGVTPNTLQVWMAKNGYRIETTVRLVPVIQPQVVANEPA